MNNKTLKASSFARWMTIASLAVVGGLGLTACNDGTDGGMVINAIVLPSDTLLNLACINVGIGSERCVLDDPENPFIGTPIVEFDANNPDAANKFELFNAIPLGPEGAKSRFYFWATALANRQSGENQYFTALALHELWDINGDSLIQEQALKAYRSVLDNFFGQVTVFTCCPGLSPDGEPVPFPVGTNELAADALYRTDATGFDRLIPGDPLLVISQLLEWGFTYQPANPPNFDDGVVSVIGG
ncbi:MAG: hypothetical protein AAGA68_11260 [Pseudomonadota bacterium]